VAVRPDLERTRGEPTPERFSLECFVNPALRNNLIVMALVLGFGVGMCREAQIREAQAHARATAYAAEFYGAGTAVGPCVRIGHTAWACPLPLESATIECTEAACTVRP
jgi:hypothetical protein